MAQRRKLRLLIPDAGGGTILTEQDALPTIEIELTERETTSAAAWRALPDVGLAGPVLDCYVDQSGDPTDGDAETVAALVELEPPPAGWTPPPGWAPVPLATAAPRIEPGLAEALADRLAQLRGDRPAPELRMPWALPGWYARAREWIEQVLREAGRPAPTAVIQSRHWGISAVMQVETPAGRSWFKAAFAPFHHEAAVTAVLYEQAPKLITPVIAIDADEGWMLLDDIAGRVVGEDRTPTRAAFESLATVQAAVRHDLGRLRAAGCPHRPIRELPDQLRHALGTPTVRAALTLTPQRIEQLVERLSAAVAAVEAIGVPDSFVHGDFHPGNAIERADGVRVFDWSDAAITNPLVDVATWASWFEDDPEHIDEIYRIFHAVRAERLGHEPGTELDRLDRTTLGAVAGAYHTISYAGILAALEPHRRSEHVGGIGEFFSLLDAATPA